MDTAICWWCRMPFALEELVHLEGARLVGSPPLALPERIPEPERKAMMVCHPCAVVLATGRRAHDVEVAEAITERSNP